MTLTTTSSSPKLGKQRATLSILTLTRRLAAGNKVSEEELDWILARDQVEKLMECLEYWLDDVQDGILEGSDDALYRSSVAILEEIKNG